MKRYYLKMSPAEFITKIIELYIEARNPRFYHPNIKRGRSHIIPGQVEDLCAAFLAFNLTTDYEYYVDQPITGKGFSLYPDIAILNKGVISNLIDIKMDLGWKRDGFVEFCTEKDQLVTLHQKSRHGEHPLG